VTIEGQKSVLYHKVIERKEMNKPGIGIDKRQEMGELKSGDTAWESNRVIVAPSLHTRLGGIQGGGRLLIARWQ